MVTPESVAHGIKVLAPVILGLLFVLVGLFQSEVNVALIGTGAGMLGIPGVGQAARGLGGVRRAE